MTLRMTIEQGDNGWVLTFTGHDCLSKKKVFAQWKDVVKEMDEYFGWYTLDGEHRKKNPYNL